VYEEYCTRRLLVSEWMEGRKLSDCAPEQIRKVTPFAQEAFLVQLFEEGFFHADPHPGNLLLLDEPTEEGHSLALIDCGLMASINQEDRDDMISAVIHLANKDYASLVDDFIKLKILPADCNRAAIVPLMDKALSPYVKGGGAKKYEEELKKLYGMDDTIQSQIGGFQAMTQDALTVLNDIPFSIPPYFAILGRAIVTLEGIALTGDDAYGIIMESYPFIARKLLREDRPEIQRALQEVLYSGALTGETSALKFTRLLALLNNAAGSVGTQRGGAFVDLDAVPDDGLTLVDGIKFLLSDKAQSLRNLLETEVDSVVDIVARQILRKGVSEAIIAFAPPRPPVFPFVGNIFPQPPSFNDVPLPILLPGDGGRTASVGVLTINQFIDKLAPKLSQDEEIYALGIADGASEFFGQDAALSRLVRAEGVLSANSAKLVLSAARSGAFGQSELLSNGTVMQVLSGISSLLESFGVSGNEDEFTEILDALDDDERERLDEIVTEVVRRSLERAQSRVSDVPRIL